MKQTLGQKIAYFRRQKALKQDDVAEIMGVSSQAVSKWENDISYPDVMSLPKLAKLFGVSVDCLLSEEDVSETRFVPAESRKKLDDMMMKIVVDVEPDTKVRVNLPIPIVKVMMESGASLTSLVDTPHMSKVDLPKIFDLVENGVCGKIIEFDSQDCHVEIVVE